MTNDNAQPLLVAGVLPKVEYSTLQEFVNDLPKVLKFPIDAVSIIKGAAGTEGSVGKRGAAGTQGPPGPGIKISTIKYNIPLGATYVEFPVSAGWEKAHYSITHRGQIGSTDASIPVYDPAAGILGAGVVVGVYAVPAPTTARCYFVYAGTITSAPDANHVLQVSYISPA